LLVLYAVPLTVAVIRMIERIGSVPFFRSPESRSVESTAVDALCVPFFRSALTDAEAPIVDCA
jgi:hypothetical protein